MPTQFAIHRAATTVRSALFFRQRLLNGLVPADAVKNGAHCMDSWRWMFDCCRIPHRPSDYAISFRPADPSPEVGVDGHFLVVRKNRFWKIANSIYDPSIGKRRLLSTKELEIRLQYVVEQTKDTLPAIGTFTASDRDSWADNYGLLASISEHNKGVLHDIHSAAFALCMDDVSPKTSQRPSKGPHGHGTSLSTASGSDPVSFTQWLWHGGPAGEKNQLGNRYGPLHPGRENMTNEPTLPGGWTSLSSLFCLLTGRWEWLGNIPSWMARPQLGCAMKCSMRHILPPLTTAHLLCLDLVRTQSPWTLWSIPP